MKTPCTTTIPHGSGAKRVTDPNELRVLFEDDIQIVENGYLYAYVSNGSSKGINFDNFLVTYAEGATRQINHYYPYGLTIAGIHGDYDDYLNKYTSKELQTGEFDPTVSTGLEMLDFGSRFYDPQVGRPDGFSFQLQWFTPDPATSRGHGVVGGSPFRTEQFANPYLAIGTTKREELLRWSNLASGELVGQAVMYVDPDGEFIITALLIGAAISATTYTASVAFSDGGFENWDWGKFALNVGIGAAAGVAGGALGGMTANALNTGYFVLGHGSAAVGSVSGFLSGAAVGAVSGFSAGFVSGSLNSWANGNDFGTGLNAGLKAGGWGALTGAGIGGLAGGIKAVSNGKSFWTNKTTFKDKVNYFISQHKEDLIDEFGQEVFESTKIKGRRLFENYGEARPTGKPTGESFLGYSGEKSKVLIARRVINDFYKSHDINSSATLFHEFFHANDYFTGFDNFVYNTYRDIYIDFLEFGAYNFENKIFNTQVGQHNMRAYIWHFLKGL